jgi:hypothetical protein
MASVEDKNAIAPELIADLEEVARQAMCGGIRDSDLVRRVRERANKARQETFAKFGLQDIGVSIIREMRNSE